MRDFIRSTYDWLIGIALVGVFLYLGGWNTPAGRWFGVGVLCATALGLALVLAFVLYRRHRAKRAGIAGGKGS
jgi:NADH:ubiquinone oxidoreductase subunit H